MSINALSRRAFLRLSALTVAGTIAACTPKVAEQPTAAPAPAKAEPTAAPKQEQPTQAPAQPTAAPAAAEPKLPAQDKLGSPDKPKGWKTTLPELPAGVPHSPVVEITCTRRVDAQTKFCEGEDLENNPWARMVEALFGVKYKVVWTWSTGDEANQKYNLAQASGDLPDFLETVPMNIFVQMVEAGQLEDLTDAYEQYAGPRWKGLWAEYGELPWTWSKIDGKIWGIPRVEDLAHNDCILWYRQDWLEKVGKDVPKTFDELKALALAFKDAKLAQTAETIGLLSSKDLYHTWYGSLDAIWGGFGYIPDHWQPEGDKLMYGAIRPEVKEALTLLNDWYQAGVFRKDYYTIETSKTMQDVGGNACGLHFTPSWGANLDSVKNDPNAKWAFADIPTGPKGFKRRHTENNFREGPFCFKKGAKTIDKVFEVTNWWEQLWWLPENRMHGWEGCNYEWDGDKVKSTGISFQNWVPGPVGTRGSGMLDPKCIGNNYRYYFDEWGKIPVEKRDAMQELILADPTGVNTANMKSRLLILETASEGVMTQFQSLPTATARERGVDLNKLRDESIINFITGQKPLSEFDAYVDQWLKLGGQKWTDEVNEWWATRKK